MSTLESDARQALHDACPRYDFPEPWSFVPPDDDIRGPARSPRRLLAELQARFGDQTLLRAGMAEPHPTHGLRFTAAIRNRHGLLIALRTSPAESPYDFLTTQGLLGGGSCPALAALDDARTIRRAFYCAVVIACGTIADAALLAALGLPATLGTGLARLSLEEFHKLNGRFGEGVPGIVSELGESDSDQDASAETEELPSSESLGATSPAGRDGNAPLEVIVSPPLLVLADWDIRARAVKPRPWVRQVAVRVAEVRRHTGLPLGGIAVWQPLPATLDRLHFALDAKDLTLVRQVLIDSLEAVADIEAVLTPEPPQVAQGPGSSSVTASLFPILPVDGFGPVGDTHDIDVLLQQADRAVQELLVEPLVTLALAQRHAVPRSVLLQLADVARLAHSLSRGIHARCRRDLLRSATGVARDSELMQYLAVLDRFGRLLVEVHRWMH